MTDAELDEKFQLADANHDNKITAEELAKFFQGRTFDIAHAHAAAGKPDRAKEREAEAIFDMSDETPDNDSYVIGGPASPFFFSFVFIIFAHDHYYLVVQVAT